MIKHLVKTLLDKATKTPVVAGPGAMLYRERGNICALAGHDRVAIVASWTDGASMSLSLSRYLHALADCGFTPVVVSTSDAKSPLEWPHGLPEDAVVLRRRNLGYDFGTWAAALEAIPGIRECAHVLLTNDSMVGPFRPLDDLIERAICSGANVVGLTDTFQAGHSLQSYFMMFNNGILGDVEWRRFFRSVRPQAKKLEYVWRYELRVAIVAVVGGYGWQTLFPSTLVQAHHRNPPVDHWRELLDWEFPFVKRTLWSDQSFADRALQAEAFLQRRFGIEAQEWLPASEPQQRSPVGEIDEVLGAASMTSIDENKEMGEHI